MNDRRDNEEREPLIADGLEGELTPDQAADVALLADILGDPAAWAEPSPELEDAVVGAVVTADAGTTVPRHRRHRYAVPAVASIAVAIAIVVGAVAFTTRGGTSAQFTAALSATPLAAGAHGSADITHNSAGFRIVLTRTASRRSLRVSITRAGSRTEPGLSCRSAPSARPMAR